MKTNLTIWVTEDEGAFFVWTKAFFDKRKCPFWLENYTQGGEIGIFQFHVLLQVFPWKWNDNEVLNAWMHHFFPQIFLFPSISSKRVATQYSSLAFVNKIHFLGPRICSRGSFFANSFNCWIAFVWTEFHFGGFFFKSWAKQFLYLEIFGMKSNM